MTHDGLPPLSTIDRKDKLILWLATNVLAYFGYSVYKKNFYKKVIYITLKIKNKNK